MYSDDEYKRDTETERDSCSETERDSESDNEEEKKEEIIEPIYRSNMKLKELQEIAGLYHIETTKVVNDKLKPRTKQELMDEMDELVRGDDFERIEIEETGPIYDKSMKVLQLQNIARMYGISITKEVDGKMKKKTKKDLMEEFDELVDREDFERIKISLTELNKTVPKKKKLYKVTMKKAEIQEIANEHGIELLDDDREKTKAELMNELDQLNL